MSAAAKFFEFSFSSVGIVNRAVRSSDEAGSFRRDDVEKFLHVVADISSGREG